MFRRGVFSKVIDTIAIGAIVVACSGGGSTVPSLPVGPGVRVQAESMSPLGVAAPEVDRGPSLDTASRSLNPNTITTCTSTAGCIGGTNASTGPGVAGVSDKGRGVSGITLLASTTATNGQYGVFGQDASKTGVYDVGVYGTSVRGVGVSGLSSSNIGARGTSTSNIGVSGASSSSIGVYGVSTSYIGVYGLGGSYGAFLDGTSYGAYGYSASGSAVFGTSSTGTGLYGATGSKGFGLQAHASGGLGAYIYNSSGNGTDSTGSYIGVVARAPASGFPLVVTDTSSNNLFYVDGAGNVYYRGTLNAFIATRNGTANAFSPTATRPSIEDTGTAHLVGGRATVTLNGALAQTIDMQRGYQVFLTPDGDTRGLYVASKSASSFVVREVQGGHGTFAFDYHVYASQLGSHAQQMTITQPNARAIQPQTPSNQPANMTTTR